MGFDEGSYALGGSGLLGVFHGTRLTRLGALTSIGQGDPRSKHAFSSRC
ncbi:hypothetical protein [Streptomyces lydicus]|nr:hypothetical protein [Streptomyces lydicus]